MDILKYKDYEGTAEVDMVRGVCRGKILFITDLVTYEAATPRELQREFELAVEDYLETCGELGREPGRQFKGLFNVRVTPELHRAAALRAASDGVSLNEVAFRALDCYLNVRADVNHNIRVTLEAPSGSLETVRAVASGKARWEAKTHVH